MPIFVFIPSSAAPPPTPNPEDLDFFVVSPAANSINSPRNTEIVFGIFSLGLSVLDTETVDVTINGSAAVVNGAAQSGYSVSYDIGQYNSQFGILYKVKRDTTFTNHSQVSIIVSYLDLDTSSYSNSYSFRVADFDGFPSYAIFGRQPTVMYRDLNINNLGEQELASYTRQSKLFYGIIESASQSEDGRVYLASDARQKELLGEQTKFPVLLGPTYAGLAKDSLVSSGGELQTQSVGRQLQLVGQQTRFPTVLAPTFGGRVLNKTVGNLPLQRPND